MRELTCLKGIMNFNGCFQRLQFNCNCSKQGVGTQKSKESTETTQQICVTWPQMAKTASFVHVNARWFFYDFIFFCI